MFIYLEIIEEPLLLDHEDSLVSLVDEIGEDLVEERSKRSLGQLEGLVDLDGDILVHLDLL